ncbi:alpha,alpha-trehalase TreA [Glacieibacterium sp.]|uniref:alpha,alpha-trehalase TreA n=1 Tax=Glacieibacterium sp. TaxID=2860237 RepID=UPI003B000DDF
MRHPIGRLFLVLATGLGLAAAAPLPPSELFGPLFRDVQLGHVFPDGKTFADAVPKRPAEAILADYAKAKPAGTSELRAFVLANFTVPGQPVAPPPETSRTTLSEHIERLWPVLSRPPETPPPGSSALALPQPYVVPGGRFREIYYWDTYFTMLGLQRSGHPELVDSMLLDFESLITRYGHIPNGTRSYYLSRSQPPMFALMAGLATANDAASLRRRLDALRREHAFWMAGEKCATAAQPGCQRVVRMPDGALLNRYYDDRAAPRDESYAEDVATAAASTRPAAETWRDLRAAAESGWDFSSRWLDDPQKLATIRTISIVPVDLNSLLYAQEIRIAEDCAKLGDTACGRSFRARAETRARAVRRWLWQPTQGRFADFDWARGRPTPVLSAATLYPLFTRLATKSEAAAVARTTAASLVAPGGLRSTTVQTGQQWDRPNGWAPLQWIAVDGLSHYGQRDIARTIACRFLGTVARNYRANGKMLEKYDVEEQRPGGGGEYPTQDGFGWTNGVTSALLSRYSLVEDGRPAAASTTACKVEASDRPAL